MKRVLGAFVLFFVLMLPTVTSADCIELADGVYCDGSTLYICSSVNTLGALQFTPTEVYSFVGVPPTCVGNSFTSYDATLHMPATSYGAYFIADYWGWFTNMLNDAVEPTCVKLSITDVSMTAGEVLNLIATVLPNNASMRSIEWTSTNTQVASVVGGQVIALAAGECDIIASCLDRQAVCHITVVETTIMIALDVHKARLLPNHALTLNPVMSPMPTTLNVTVSDPQVAAARLVNDAVNVVGLSEGTTMIVVSSIDGLAVPDTCLVTVYTELGDVNCDGYVTIGDVTTLINYLLGGNVNPFSVINADTNCDEKVSIGDVTMLINHLLGNINLNPPVLPKREFRSAWITTVWCLDWPSQGVGATKQKAQMDRLLDSLQVNRFNAVNFQVRSMCDAMYQSSIEPWSSYLTGTRGADPGFDPLQYVVEGCHKRGMECHAWVNPYRWSTGTNWNTPYDQELKNDGWLLTHGSTIILDPGQQRTIDRIVEVCKEIITNYDVDGILFDDYFYPSGIPTDETAQDYGEWQASGPSMSFGDWRRDNVNRMVKAVYDMIQETRPDVRYGVSPAGVAATSSFVASKYGVAPCPSGSDWQYDGIFSDPLAWYEAHSIDYMSPQVYWPFGHSTNDYGRITQWWGRIAEHFGRQVFISSSISGLTSSSGDVQYKEYADEVEFNRTSSLDNAPGAIFYSCKYLYALNSNPLGHYLKNTVFTRPALPPAMPWKDGYNPGEVQNLERVSDQLQWDGFDNVRYTVYAFPITMNLNTFAGQIDYLLGMTYEPSYEIPSEYQQGYQFAVCVLDRVGNEWHPAFLSEE